MMEPPIVLCTDFESMKDPSLIGLGGESLEAQAWLRVFCNAVEARRYLQEMPAIRQVWVASNDEILPINLAAALKKDSPSREVRLLAFQGSGSLKSRASAAGLDATLDQQGFAKCYANAKQRYQANGQAKAQTMLNTERGQEAGPGNTGQAAPFAVHLSPQIIGGGREKPGYVLSVVSATGGSGKSTIAALSALFSQGFGHRTLLLDADLQFGDMRYILGGEDPLTIDELIADPGKALKLKPDGLRPALLAAPARLEQSETVAGHLPALLDHLKMLFPVIVVNTGAFWAEQHAALLERSSTALFLIDQRASSLRSCKHAVDLCTRCGIATHPFVFAVNRCTRTAPLSSIDVSCALQGAPVHELQDGGRDVGDLVGAGMPFELINTKNDLCLSLESMLSGLVPQADEAKREKVSASRPKRLRFGRRRRRVACL